MRSIPALSFAALTFILAFSTSPSFGQSADLKDVIVTNAFKAAWTKASGGLVLRVQAKSIGPGESELRLGDALTVQISNLAKLKELALAKGKAISLFLNGIEVTNLVPQSVSSNSLTFYLERTPANKDVWSSILRRPFQEKSLFEDCVRQVGVSIGFSKGEPQLSEASIGFIVFSWQSWWIKAWLVLFTTVLALFAWCAAASDLLRDPGPQPAKDPQSQKPPRKTFSLARVQMAFWFGIVIVSYVLIWIITGDTTTINSSVLALIGISAGTYFGAVAVDTRNGQPAPEVSKGFFIDLVSANSGVEFHRFQILVWTIVLGIMFLTSVCNELYMPEFNAALLGLMGISSGTYVGYKFKES
jgi:hypothetical protein